MANDVNILVTAELGDTLLKLGLAKHAIKDLGDESEETAAKQEEAAASSAFFQDALGGLNKVLTASIPLFPGFSAPIAAFPLVAFAAVFALNALADAIGTVIAVMAALVAPVTVVTGLLGGLAAGFVLAAKKAFGMHEDGLGKAVSGLKKQFNDLTTTLVGRFMPVFQFLIHNAHDALDFLNRIAKLPLNEAFRKLAQQGIPAVEKFLGKVGSMVAKPIRIAFQIAFGGGQAGNEAQAAVSHLWKQFTDFLFGYTKTHPIRLPGGRIIELDKQHVDGIFQPLIDWFNRHHFTKEGFQIANSIMAGVERIRGPLETLLGSIFLDAAKKSFDSFNRPLISFVHVKADAKQFFDWLKKTGVETFHYDANQLKQALGAAFIVVARLGGRAWERIKQLASGFIHGIATIARTEASSMATATRSLLSHAWSAVRSLAVSAWNSIKSQAVGAIQSIANHFSAVRSAINTAKGVANTFMSVLRQIAGFFARVFTFHVNWPSPPGWLSSLLSKGGSILDSIPHPSVSIPSVSSVVPNVAAASAGGNVAVINIHGADLSSSAQRKRIGAQLGDTLVRRWAQQAGR